MKGAMRSGTGLTYTRTGTRKTQNVIRRRRRRYRQIDRARIGRMVLAMKANTRRTDRRTPVPRAGSRRGRRRRSRRTIRRPHIKVRITRTSGGTMPHTMAPGTSYTTGKRRAPHSRAGRRWIDGVHTLITTSSVLIHHER